MVLYAFRSYQLTYHTSNSNCLFLKLQFQALLGWIIISADLLKLKTAVWHVLSVVAFAVIEVAYSPPQAIKKIWTVYHWHRQLYIPWYQNRKCISSSAETELAWQKGHVFGSHTHQFPIYSNRSVCWGPIIIIILAQFSVRHSQNVTFLLTHPYW